MLASLVGLVVRVAIGLAIAFVLALLLTLVVWRSDFARSFAVACLVIGCFTLMMAFGGSSPSRRMGIHEDWLVTFFPRLVRPMGEQYPQTRLSDAAVFVLTAGVLLVAGFIVLG